MEHTLQGDYTEERPRVRCHIHSIVTNLTIETFNSKLIDNEK